MTGVAGPSMDLSQMLKTPDSFDIDNPEDVRQELERLEDLAAEHHELNMNEQFITRFKHLQNQQDQLKTNNNSINHTDRDTISSGSFINADSFFDASEQVKPESPPCNDQWKGKGKQRQVFWTPTMLLDANAATKILTDNDIVQITQ